MTPSPGRCDHPPVSAPVPIAEPRWEETTPEEIADGRILAAVAYLPALCFVAFAAAPTNRYVRFHARQGLLLFGAEVTAWIALWILDVSVGRIPFLGILVMAAVRLAVGLVLLGATVYGVAKGASGEFARFPFLGEGIEKVPF